MESLCWFLEVCLESQVLLDQSMCDTCGGELTSSVYDCTVEDVEYIYNKLSI